MNGIGRTLGLLLLPLLLSGCGDLFDVENPTNIVDEELEAEAMWTALGNSPEGVFSLGYDHLLLDAALIADEGTHHATRTSRIELFQGTIAEWNEQYDARYNEMARARWVADDIRERLGRLLASPDSDRRMAHAYFWGALSRVVLAEHFVEIPIDGGPPQSPADILESSVPLFDQAAQIASAAGETRLAAATHGAKARALRSLYFERDRDMGLLTQAAQAAQQALNLDPSYRLDVRYQQPGTQNSFYARASTGSQYDGMDPRYANQVDPVSGERDQRIQHTDAIATDGWGRTIYEPLKYQSRNDDIPVSRWQEAQLIIAEHHLESGDLPGAVNRINQVRGAAGLPDFGGGDAEEIFSQLEYERRTEFWLEGRRWQDMRYYNLVPPEWTSANQQRGVERRWPVSQQERDANQHYR